MKTLLAILFASLTTQLVFAKSEIVLPSSFQSGAKKITFVDFIEATHNITYDLTKKIAFTKSVITFRQEEVGFPVIDLVETPTSVVLNEISVSSFVATTPLRETQIRVIDKELSPGTHSITLEAPITTLVDFRNNSLKSAFWYTDLNDRSFLEQYLPANLEFDQTPVVFNIEFIGLTQKQKIYANGDVKWHSDTQASVTFPNYFTASSFFFHTAPEGSFLEIDYEYPSINGRSLPIKIYTPLNAGSNQLTKGKENLANILAELEANFGAFPHPNLLVYLSLPSFGLGGMEYSGATVTSMEALSHEIFHSYMARGLMPANGNAGWVDEALASWRDSGYPSRSSLSSSVNLSNAGPYIRKTNRAAYTHGANFMSLLNFKLKDKGGLKPFLKSQFEKNMFTTFTISSFIESMEEFFETALMPDFQKHTYKGRNLSFVESPYHRKLTMTELQQLL